MLDPNKKSCLHCDNEDLERSRFCKDCGAMAREIEDDEVLNYGRCPACGRFSLGCSSTIRPIRYLKCGNCGKNIKSIEVLMIHFDALQLADEIIKDRRRF